MKKHIISVALCLVANAIFAEVPRDSTLRNNVLKVDFTSRWLYRDAYVITWEHAFKNNQSFAVSAGYQEFRPLSLTILNKASRELSSSGYKAAAEYRFYLKKENKHAAPRGVYVGPYAALNHFKNRRIVTSTAPGVDGEIDLELSLHVLNLGAQIGYQFTLWDRLAIDLIFMGPSLSYYTFKRQVYSSFDIDQDEITNDIFLLILDRFPGLEDALNFDAESVSKGRSDTWSYGFRYQVHLGYRFGTGNLFKKKP